MFNYNGKPMMHYVWDQAGSFSNRSVHLGKMKHDKLIPVIKNANCVVFTIEN